MPGRILSISILIVALCCASAVCTAQQTTLHPHTARTAPEDLELSGLPGLAPDTVRYISYRELASLPQVTFTPSPDDENFSLGFAQPVTITGVRLETLAAALGIDVATIMPIAMCSDGYRANYPAAYIAAHHPVIVLAVNHLAPTQWPRSRYGDIMAPYIISHDHFVPSFSILSHQDEMQIPYAVTRIEFRNERDTFAAISPPGVYIPESPVFSGFAIAKQNCFRCHNNGTAGGTMAHLPWQALSAVAAGNPNLFTSYVHNPASLRKDARMPGNPEYDDATLDALRRYFATFSSQKKESTTR